MRAPFVIDSSSLKSSLRNSRSYFLSLSLLLGLSLAACGGGGGSSDDGTTDDGTTDDGSTDGSADDGGDSGDGGDDPGVGFEQPPLTEGLATLAGTSFSGTANGDREHGLFNNPVNVAVADDGSIIVADFDNSMVRRVTPEGDVSTLSEPPLEGMFVRPFGLVVVGSTIYVQTDGNSLGQPGQNGQSGGALWSLPLAGGVPTLLADNIGRVRGLERLADGRIAMADFRAHVIRLFDPGTRGVQLLAGGLNAPGFRDGVAAQASFNQPYDMVALADGTLLVSDFGNHSLRVVGMDGNVTTYAGTADVPGRADGDLASATFNAPQGLTQDSAGNIYVTDTGNYLIRKISPDGEVTTIAGNASPGYLDSEDPLAGQLFGIEGIDAGDDGYLYIADGSRGNADAPHHRVRRLSIE